MKKIILILTIVISACSATPTIIDSEPVTEAAPQSITPPTALPAGPVTLVALGDSLTQGDGDDTGSGYPGRLIAMVNELRPDSDLTNFGQSGWNSDALINGDQGLPSQLDRAVAEIQIAVSEGRGAVALVWIGSNDLWYLYEYGGNVGDPSEAADREHFSTNLQTILSRLREAGALVFIALLDDQSLRPIAVKGEAFPSTTKAELKQMSVQVQRYNEIIAERAAQNGAVTVDFYHTEIFTNPATLYDDGNHPNPAGYDLIAQLWFGALRPFLANH
ncbi:MAG: hypothetical protein IT310_03775 [Anaerolineales bacterium]|nr:hypothetical protein [Anaerolineales bacterium]